VSQTDKSLTGEVQDNLPAEASSAPDGWQREVRSPITGRWVVASRPGERKVTSEEIYRLLREDEELEDLKHLEDRS
jgi:hypothetical protein